MKKLKPVTVERIDEILLWMDEGASFHEATEDYREHEDILKLARDGALMKQEKQTMAKSDDLSGKFKIFIAQVKTAPDAVLHAILDNIKSRIGDAVIDQNKPYEKEQLFKAKIVLDELNERLGVPDEVVSS